MDFKFTTKETDIDIFYNDPINIWFFGDVHRDTQSCDVERWRWFHRKAKLDPVEKTYFVGMGDFNDFASASEQKALMRGNLHETTHAKLDEIVQRDNRRFANEISFMRGRLLGMVEGNHSWVFHNGETATEDLAQRMDCPALGWLCYYVIRFKIKNTNKRHLVHMVLCHGKAGGKTAGNTLNQVDDLRRIFPAADIYVMAHDHERGAWPKSVIIHTGRKLKQKRQYLCRSGSFKKGYTPNESGYEVGRLLRPSDLGALKLKISLHRETEGKNDLIITDIEAEI